MKGSKTTPSTGHPANIHGSINFGGNVARYPVGTKDYIGKNGKSYCKTVYKSIYGKKMKKV